MPVAGFPRSVSSTTQSLAAWQPCPGAEPGRPQWVAPRRGAPETPRSCRRPRAHGSGRLLAEGPAASRLAPGTAALGQRRRRRPQGPGRARTAPGPHGAGAADRGAAPPGLCGESRPRLPGCSRRLPAPGRAVTACPPPQQVRAQPGPGREGGSSGTPPRPHPALLAGPGQPRLGHRGAGRGGSPLSRDVGPGVLVAPLPRGLHHGGGSLAKCRLYWQRGGFAWDCAKGPRSLPPRSESSGVSVQQVTDRPEEDRQHPASPPVTSRPRGCKEHGRGSCTGTARGTRWPRRGSRSPPVQPRGRVLAPCLPSSKGKELNSRAVFANRSIVPCSFKSGVMKVAFDHHVALQAAEAVLYPLLH